MDFLDSLDDNTLHWFETVRNPRRDALMIDLTALGGPVVLTLVVLFTAGLLLCLRRYRTAGFLLAAAVGGALLSTGIKQWIERPRPPFVHPRISPELSPSFPSGHSMLSAVVYLTLALIATAVIPRRLVRVYVIGASLLLVGLIGISRMYLGVHYPTDVTAGWAFGLAWAVTGRWVESRWVLRAERRAAAAGEAEP